jgi:hypothetical protein
MNFDVFSRSLSNQFRNTDESLPEELKVAMGIM